MQIAGQPLGHKSRGGKFLKAKIKQTLVVGFQIQLSIGLEYTAIKFEESAIGQTALSVPRLGPRVAEVQIDAVRRVLGKPLGKVFSISDKKPQIVGAFLGTSFGFFQRKTRHIGDALHGNEITVGIFCRHAAGKIALATADLDIKRTLFGKSILRVLGQRRSILNQKFATCGDACRTVFLFSHSHMKFFLSR